MNMSPFYELRNRLYASAASGCAAINEDFRLKRAVEAFEPLAGANKVFMKLYTDCGKLFVSDSPADILPDCIALADALAVTQGSFGENSETVPSEIKTEMKIIPAQYSELSALCEKIKKCSPKLAELSSEEIKLLSDVRVLTAFIKASENRSSYLDDFAENIIGIWGRIVVPMLKNAIDLTDEKASGTRVKYIFMAAGAEENDYYSSLASDTTAPQDIRISAIKAMENSTENGDILLDIYNTSKGKVKNAALMAVLTLGLPESDEMIGKLINKAKGDYYKYCDYVKISSCNTAVLFVRAQIMETSETIRSRNKSKPIMPIENTVELFRNKSCIADCFIEAAELSRLWDGSDKYVESIIQRLNDVLIKNLKHKDNEKYRSLICGLYEKMPDDFVPAYFFLRLLDDPENAMNGLSERLGKRCFFAAQFLSQISYSPAKKAYCIPYSYIRVQTDWKAVLFESFPDSMLGFISSLSDIKTESYDSVCYSLREFVSHCAPHDRERIRNAALEVVFKIAKKSPSYICIELIAEYCPESMGYRCRGIVSDYIIDTLISRHSAVHCSIINRLPLSYSDKIEELTELMNRAAAAKGDFTEDTRNTVMHYIRNEIDSIMKG